MTHRRRAEDRAGTLLAAVADDGTAPTILHAATGLGRLLGCEVRGVHVGDGPLPASIADAAASAGVHVDVVEVGDGDVVAELTRLFEHDDVRLGAIASRTRPATGHVVGQVSSALIATLATPLLIVSPETYPTRLDEPQRVLVPFGSDQHRTEAVDRIIELLRAAGLDIVVQHVVDPSAPIPVLDHVHHGLTSWRHEFLARATDVEDDLRLHRGTVSRQVVGLVRSGDFHLVVLAWSQDLSEGRAPVVRRVLEQCGAPVVLVPVARDEPFAGPGSSRDGIGWVRPLRT